jgi:hypothetical protein
MLEALLQFLAEIAIQLLFELAAEIGQRSFTEPFRKPANPWFAAIGYFGFGVVAGFLSLLLFSAHLIAGQNWRIVNLIVTPIVAGLLMSAIGLWRAKREQLVLRIDRFSYGYLFALAFALVRFFLAR